MRKRFTNFETDQEDKKNAFWDKVFLKLHDFGEIFEKGNGVPTVYGPIQFLLKPEVLVEASDVAISLRSAGSHGFDRNKEAWKGVEEVNRIFRYAVDEIKSKGKEIMQWVGSIVW